MIVPLYCSNLTVPGHYRYGSPFPPNDVADAREYESTAYRQDQMMTIRAEEWLGTEVSQEICQHDPLELDEVVEVAPDCYQCRSDYR